MLVWVLNVARWAKCLVRYSRVLNTVKEIGFHLVFHENGTANVRQASQGQQKGCRGQTGSERCSSSPEVGARQLFDHPPDV